MMDGSGKPVKRAEIDEAVVRPYRYRDQAELEEVYLSGRVEEVGEGAFLNCAGLRAVLVGRQVKRVEPMAFIRIARYADIVWLGTAPYKSPLMRILPPFSEIRGLCAPFAAFPRAGEEEKLALAAGYILHPEWEELYSEDLRGEYGDYIRESLVDHLSGLREKGCIFEVLVSLWNRGFLKEKEEVRRYLAYARSCRVSGKEKTVLDRIEQEAGLAGGEEVFLSEEAEVDKRLLRLVREEIPDGALRACMEKEKIGTFPRVFYGKDGREAPPEAVKYILYRYMSQWTEGSVLPNFHFDERADRMAALLEPDSLLHVLKELGCPETEGPDGSRRVPYPRRLIPLLRYADGALTSDYVRRWKEWREYPVYGFSGYQAASVLERAILLNDSEEALIFAGWRRLLPQYARLRGQSEERLFTDLTALLERQGREELGPVLDQWRERLYEDYLTGREWEYIQWKRSCLDIPSVREITSQLIYLKNGTEAFCLADGSVNEAGEAFCLAEGAVNEAGEVFCLADGGVNEAGEAVPLGPSDRISFLHPVCLDDESYQKWKQASEACGFKPPFEQLYEIRRRYSMRDFEEWRSRYEKLCVPAERMKELARRGMELEGSFAEKVRISFHRKEILFGEAASAPAESQAGVGPRTFERELSEGAGLRQSGKDRLTDASWLTLSKMEYGTYGPRELHEAIHILDEVFCYEMLLEGRMEAGPHLGRLTEEQREAVLEASIRNGYHENVAALLAYKKKTVGEDKELRLD